MMLGEEPRWKILMYLLRIGDFKGAASCIFWKEKKWFSSNQEDENNETH